MTTDNDQQFAVNALAMIARTALFSNTSQDAKHTYAWEAYGYKSTLEFDNFYNMYDRFGTAAGVVEIPVDESWSSMPKVTGSKAVIDAVQQLDDESGFWAALIELDTRQRVGRYACLVPEIRDNSKLTDKPVARGPESVQAFKPLYEGQIKVIKTNDDGSPKEWQLNEDGAGDKNEAAGRSGIIHIDRVMHWAEGASGTSVYGRSCLRQPFNSLVTLEKIIGAGGEGFFKNAKGGKLFDIDKTNGLELFKQAMGSQSIDDAKRKFNERLAAYNAGVDGAMVTSGFSLSPDSISLSDPDSFARWALNDIAASARIPATVLIGQQTGRLASDEDQYQLAKMATARRARFLTPMIKRTIKWLQRINVIPAGEFGIDWPDLFEPSVGEKLDNLGKLAGTVSKAGYSLNMAAALKHFGIPPELVSGEPEDLTETDGETDNEE